MNYNINMQPKVKAEAVKTLLPVAFRHLWMHTFTLMEGSCMGEFSLSRTDTVMYTVAVTGV